MVLKVEVSGGSNASDATTVLAAATDAATSASATAIERRARAASRSRVSSRPWAVRVARGLQTHLATEPRPSLRPRQRVTTCRRFPVIGVRLVPAEGVDDPARRGYLEELARKVKQVAVGRLHTKTLVPSDPEFELDLGCGETMCPHH